MPTWTIREQGNLGIRYLYSIYTRVPTIVHRRIQGEDRDPDYQTRQVKKAGVRNLAGLIRGTPCDEVPRP